VLVLNGGGINLGETIKNLVKAFIGESQRETVTPSMRRPPNGKDTSRLQKYSSSQRKTKRSMQATFSSLSTSSRSRVEEA
jgi:hypothetical protein